MKARQSSCRSRCPASRCACASSKRNAATRRRKSRNCWSLPRSASRRTVRTSVPAADATISTRATKPSFKSSRRCCARHWSAAGSMCQTRSPCWRADPWGYRNRIRLAFDAQGNPGYRGRRSHAVIPIRECPIAAPLLVRAAVAAGEVVEVVRANAARHRVGALLQCGRNRAAADSVCRESREDSFR